MDLPSEETPIYEENIKIESKKYELKSNNNIYLLTINLYSKTIEILVTQINNLALKNFSEEFDYEILIKELFSIKDEYDNLSKIYNFFNNSVEDNKINFIENKLKKEIILSFKKSKENKEIECRLKLKENQLNKNDIIYSLLNELIEMKSKIKDIIKDNDELKNNIKLLIDENKNIKKQNEGMENNIKLLLDSNFSFISTIDTYKKYLDEKIKEYEKEKEIKKTNKNKFIKDNITKEHKNFQDLKFYENLKITNASVFALYTGLRDHYEYIVYPKYSSDNNVSLVVMRLIDNESSYLKEHTSEISFIKYYQKENTKEEYLLSGDKNNLVIIWDIQRNYEKNYKIDKSNSQYYIRDALLFYNILDEKNYILVSNYDKGKNAKIYEFKNNSSFYDEMLFNGAQFIKNIFRNNTNIINYMILWLYKNEYFLIECCDEAVYINMIFQDRCYAILKGKNSKYGYLYRDNYLLVNSYEYINIYDLINKELNKQIKFNGYIYKFISLDKNNIIIACENGLIIYDFEKENIAKIITDNKKFKNIDIIKINQIGECLIANEDNNLVVYKF